MFDYEKFENDVVRQMTAVFHRWTVFANSDTYEYTEQFDEHCDKIIENCKNALIRFRQVINKDHSDVLLTFNIREYLDGDERTEIFQAINDEDASEEYAEHIEDYA